MGISDFVAITLSLSSSQSPTRQGFGVPLLAGYFDNTHWQGTPDRVRIYSSSSALVALAADGFAVNEPIYRAMVIALSAPQVPAQIAVGRRANPFTQILKLTATSNVVGDPYRVTVIGSDNVSHQHTLTGTGVVATDAASLDALMTESNIGTVTVSGATITITQAAGKLTDLLQWTPNLTIQNTTTNPAGGGGLLADLVAIKGANPTGWYSLSLDSNSAAEIAVAQSFVEATGVGGKWGFYDCADAIDVTTSTSDVFSSLQALGYKKCHVGHSGSQVLSYAGFAMASQILALYPGSYALSYKALPGVIADTDATVSETQQLILNSASTSNPGTGGKNGNWYKTVNGLNVTFPGSTPAGGWVDTGIFCDWLQANAQADVFAVLAGLPKVPMTDTGLGLIGQAIRTRLQIGASPPYGGIDASRPITVTIPTAASLSQTDRNNRNASGFSSSAFLSNAINTTETGITLTP